LEELTIKTQKKKEIVDITKRVEDFIKDGSGLCHLFILHTTACLSTADLDPGTDKDMLDAFDELIPDLDYRHPHNPAHVPDHILSTIIGPSLVIPFENGKLNLGTWQRVVLIEMNGPRERVIKLSTIKTE
jgi:secondary thiamine-phosphate synthase enzyme